MDEQQPELRWAPLPSRPKKTGRIWLTIGLAVAVLAIVAALLLFFLSRDDFSSTTADASPSPSQTTSESSSAPSGTAETSAATPPAVTAPTPDEFRNQVSGWLDDALQGLDIVADSSGADALPVVETLQQDALRLSDAQPPSSIDQQWRDGVSTYANQLAALKQAITDNSGVGDAIDAARIAAEDLRALAGL